MLSQVSTVLLGLTFIGPCIVIHSYSKTNKIHLFLKLFILVKYSTCFGRSFRPSSGAQDCTYINRYTRCDQKVPRLIFLLCCGYTSGHPCLQGGILELPLSLGQGMVPAHLSVLCELRSKRVVYLRLAIVRAAEGIALVCGNKHAAGSRVR